MVAKSQERLTIGRQKSIPPEASGFEKSTGVLKHAVSKEAPFSFRVPQLDGCQHGLTPCVRNKTQYVTLSEACKAQDKGGYVILGMT